MGRTLKQGEVVQNGLPSEIAEMSYVPRLMLATALKGFISNMTRMPMLNICRLFPDMYNMKAFMGKDLAGDIAMSHARFSLI